MNQLATAPSRAREWLAESGAKLSDTFNNTLSVYGNESLRPLSSMLVVSTSGVLDLGALTTRKATLNLQVLNSQHDFDLKKVLTEDLPTCKDVAGQTLTNLAL